MTTSPSASLRPLIAEIVREAVAELVTDSLRGSPTGPPSAAPPAASIAGGPEPTDTRSEPVRIVDDDDLDRFARHLLALFENPKNRQDLRTGRLRFRLAPTSGVPTAARPARVRRVERGAVTERQVVAAHENGEALVLGPRAVLTPLGRDKARVLGVHTEKER